MNYNYRVIIVATGSCSQQLVLWLKTGEFHWCSSKRRPTAGRHAYPGGEQPQSAGDDAHRGCPSAACCRRLPWHAGV